MSVCQAGKAIYDGVRDEYEAIDQELAEFRAMTKEFDKSIERASSFDNLKQ